MEIPEDIRRAAADIMAQACLGDPWASNGVEAALQKDIARAILAERERLHHCISMAMGCLNPLSDNPDERLAWGRLLDGLEGHAIRTPSTGEEQ